MPKLKILFITEYYPYEENIRGLFIKEHAKAASLYNEVIVINGLEVEKPTKKLYKINDTINGGIREIHICYYAPRPFPKIFYPVYLWALLKIVKKLLNEGFMFDVIHAHEYFFAFPAILLSRYFRIPLVITEHFSYFPLGAMKGLKLLKARLVMNRANVILPVSYALQKAIEGCGIRGNFEIIPNTVDTRLFYTSRKKDEDKQMKKILFVGLLKPTKGIFCLIEALAKVNEMRHDFKLDIVGDGPCRAIHERQAKDLGLEDKVIFHGLKTKKEVSQFMMEADFFVLPSEWENLPCVLIEAMASGLPVIATKVGGIPEMVTEKAGKLVSPKNSNALAEAINYMLDHYIDYSSEEIAMYAEERYSYKTVEKALDRVYRDLSKE